TTSLFLISSFTRAIPAGLSKFMSKLFLPRLHWLKRPERLTPPFIPAGYSGKRRVTSIRPCDSILMTSAPRWARCIVQYGPAHTHVKSATRTPANGRRDCEPLDVTLIVCGGIPRRVEEGPSVSSLCSPSRGAGGRIFTHGSVNFYG